MDTHDNRRAISRTAPATEAPLAITREQGDRIIGLLEQLVAARKSLESMARSGERVLVDKHREPPPEAYEIVGAKLRRYKQAGR